MAHFKISLAGQLHFAPHAGDWGSLFALFLLYVGPMQNRTPTTFPMFSPQKELGAPSETNIERLRR